MNKQERTETVGFEMSTGSSGRSGSTGSSGRSGSCGRRGDDRHAEASGGVNTLGGSNILSGLKVFGRMKAAGNVRSFARFRVLFSFLGVLAALVVVGGGSGCIGILDNMGREEEVKDVEDLFKDQELEDDKIEDKNPSYDPDRYVEEVFEGCVFRVNKSGTVTKLDVVAFDDDNEDLESRLFNDRGEALEDLAGRKGVDIIPSLEVVNGSLKGFNDGLYASIEVGVQEGVEEVFESKRLFLQTLAERLADEHEVAVGAVREHLGSGLAYVVAGLLASGEQAESFADIDGSVMADAQVLVDAFLGNPIYALPIGFYSWNETLQQVFTQDRFFQSQLSEIEEGDVPSVSEVGRYAAIAAVVKDATDLRPQYESYLALYSGLTNPYNSFSVADLFDYVDGTASLEDVDAIRTDFAAENSSPFICRGTYFALFPSSMSKDSSFFLELFCNSPPPADVSFIDVLINGIREGHVDLTPDPETSGWYDYQLYALETLLLPNRGPESDHLLLTKAYKEKLIDTFKSIITQTRETHVKQLDIPGGATSAPAKDVDVYPKFPVEPFPTFYLRTARGYRFLKTYLLAVLGEGFLSARGRLFSDDTMAEKSLLEELDEVIKRTYGLYVVSSRSVGLDPEEYLMEEETAEFSIEDCVAEVDAWLAGWQTDEDILADPRVIVPVGMDYDAKKIIYWATIGVKVIEISAEFVEDHFPEVSPAPESSHCNLRDIVGRNYFLLMEEMQEVRIRDSRPPLTREEFREICDAHDNTEDIVSALEAL